MANTTGKKYGGRQKGTPNRLTKELRTTLKNIMYLELAELQDSLNKLSPKERLEVLIKIMPYVLPKVEVAPHSLDEPQEWLMEW